MADFQKTIKEKITISGVGLHTGKPVNLTLVPAPPHHWFKFQRTDLPGQPIIDADVDYVVNTERGTTLGKEGVLVHTTEHILAALVGMDLIIV